MTVYIPTMNRHGNLEKIVPAWLGQNIPVRLVVEPKEYNSTVLFTRQMGWRGRVRVIPVPTARKGIGYARKFCVTHAGQDGLPSVIMSDDDMRPVSDMRPLLDAAEGPGVLGIGAVRSIHDYFTGGGINKARANGHTVILCPGGWGMQLFALNVKKALEVGNFDPKLHSAGEDAELERQGISQGIPWLVHCEARCTAIGARYAPGGINARFALPEYRTDAENQCLAIIHDRWPEYTNAPGKRLRMAWQRMLTDYIPDWKDRSAIHGGSL